MNLSATRAQLRALAGTKKKVRLARTIPHERHHNGFVLAVGRRWFLLWQFHDFSPEGLTAIRIDDVVSLRSGERERLWERMLDAEGTLKRFPRLTRLPLDGIGPLLGALKHRRIPLILECEDPKEDLEDFYIGRIVSVVRGAVRFAHFDGLGRWEQPPSMIPLGEITKIQIDTPYARTFAKYLAPYRAVSS